MTIQLDTNILTRIAQPTHSFHLTAVAAIKRLESQGHTMCVVPQNLYEFWSVATRPIANNGLGLSVVETKVELEGIKKSFALHLDPPSLLAEWEKLVVAFDCKGKPSHDARIIASMNVRGITQLLTFNAADFERYGSVTLLDPSSVSTQP
jgi:predicted nucleic acid-binding protein